MKHIPARIALGFAGLFAAALPASAGDMSNAAAGGIKDYGSAGIAVPAPMPYEETYKWYLRGDLGTAFKSQGTTANDGMPVNATSPSEWHELSIISLGFGRYITPSLRTEFTLDYRAPRALASGVSTTKDATITKTTATEVDINAYHGAQDETIKYQNSTFLVSAFYDLNSAGRFKPYIGAGIGIAMHQLSRKGSETYTCFDSGSSVTIAAVTTPGCSTNNGLQTQIVSTSASTAIGYGMAAQLSAGIGYDITPRTHWDTGYRMMWQSGRLGVASADGMNSVRINNHTDHEIRTGIRWDLW